MTRCLLCDRAAPVVGYACSPCFLKLDQTLRDIETEAALLSAAPTLAHTDGRGGTLASQRAPARLDVLVLTDPRTAAGDDGTLGVLACLGSWARAIREDRGLAWPDRITVASERRTLTAQLDWAARQPWIDDLADELAALLRQLRRANGTAPEPPVGRCYLPGPTGTCGGPIWADDAHGTAGCGRCGATWTGPQLAHLKWEMDRQDAEAARPHTDDGRPHLTAAELAGRKGVTVNAIRIRLHKAGVRSPSGYYHPDSLEQAGA